ncbi:MAG: DnaD domain protein [Lacticaseibacillus songhuajiangensis]|nr:DnaD domain protein [Lacticaseibacillus songhuajiangensis]
MQRPAELTPQSDYLVTRAQLMSDLDRQTLVYLYQPIIGPLATALYQTLWTQVRTSPQFTRDRQPHRRLMQTLGSDMDALYAARVRLEAVGLIKSYTQVDAVRHYVYELYAPMRPQDFLKDDLLSLALYDVLGSTGFAEAAEHFTVRPVRRSDMTDVSKSFMDVFHIASSPLNPPAAVEEQRQRSSEKASPIPRVDTSLVDWELLGRLLEKQNLRSDELLRQRMPIAQISGFYGMSTSELARLCARAIDTLTGRIDIKVLRNLAERDFAKQDVVKNALKRENSTPATTPTASTNSQTAPQEFSAAERELLQNARRMTPREFLNYTKKKKSPDAFAGKNELWALQQLAGRDIFTNATINVLVDYLLQERTSISQSYMDAVANSWLEAGVNSPESALMQIKAYQAGKTKRTPARRNYQRNRVVEPQPEWAKEGHKVAGRVLSAKERAELNAKLASLRQKKDGDQ